VRPWRFRTRLLAATTGLVVLAVAALTALWLSLVRQQLTPSELLSPILAADLREAVVARARQAEERLRLVAHTPDVVNDTFYHLVLQGEVDHPRAALANLGRQLGPALFILTDRTGHPFAHWPATAALGEEAARRLAPAIAQGRPAAEIFLASDGIHWAGTAPVVHNELPIAAVVSEEILGDPFLDHLAGITGFATLLAAPSGRILLTSHVVLKPASRLRPGQWIATDGGRLLPLTVAVADGGGQTIAHLGILRPDLFTAFVRRSLPVTLPTVVPFIILAVSLAWGAAHHLARPLREMAAAAHRLGHGDFDIHLDEGGSQEVAMVAAAFNRMAADLAAATEKRAAVERQAARSQRLAAVGQLAAGVAHQINNPLANILGLARAVEGSQELDPALRESVAEIARQAYRGSAVVRRLLGFADLPVPRRETTDLTALARGVVDGLGAEAAGGGVSLTVAGEAVVVAVDVVQVEEALTNLVRNAIQACRPGEGVAVAVAADDGGGVVRVADNGPGIPAPLAERVFDPFFTTRKAEGGSGLGLAVVAAIAAAHGGEVTLAGGVGGRGACFTLCLPAAEVCP